MTCIARTIPSANFLQMKVQVKGDDLHLLAKDGDVAKDLALADDHHLLHLLLPCSLDWWGPVSKWTMVHKFFCCAI